MSASHQHFSILVRCECGSWCDVADVTVVHTLQGMQVWVSVAKCKGCGVKATGQKEVAP